MCWYHVIGVGEGGRGNLESVWKGLLVGEEETILPPPGLISSPPWMNVYYISKYKKLGGKEVKGMCWYHVIGVGVEVIYDELVKAC